MTAPPAGALEACLALLEKATPGEWFAQQATKYTHLRAVGDKHGNPYVMEGGYRHPVRTADDAKAIAAAVNLLRTHGPALLAALRLREGCEALVAVTVKEAERDMAQCLLASTVFKTTEHRAAWNFAHGRKKTADDLARVLEEGE